jgi:hypothetical protein
MNELYGLRNDPLKRQSLAQYRQIADKIQLGLETDRYKIEITS